MKKTYIAPVLNVVTVGTMKIIAASTLNPGDANPSVTVSGSGHGGEFNTKQSDWTDIWN